MAQQTLITIFQEYSNHWMTWLNEFTKTDFFHQFGLLIVAIVAGSPAFASVPNELVTTPLYALGVNPIYIVLAVGIGGFFGDVLLYYFGYHLLRRLTKGHHDRLLEVDNWVHNKGLIIYVASPFLFFGLGDLIMIISGHQGVRLSKIAPFLFAGEILRGIVGIWITMGLISFANIPWL